MSQAETTRELSSAPASVQTVLRELAGHAPMTGKQLREATGLPRRTIYTALSKLRQLGILEERSSLRDTRQTYFWVPGEKLEGANIQLEPAEGRAEIQGQHKAPHA